MNDQLEFNASASKSNCSQVDRLLSAFHDAGENTWVPMPQLARAMSPSDQGTGNCPPRRIYDLRKKIEPDGFTIENRKQWIDGVCHSFYRIIRHQGTKAQSNSVSSCLSGPTQQPHPSP